MRPACVTGGAPYRLTIGALANVVREYGVVGFGNTILGTVPFRALTFVVTNPPQVVLGVGDVGSYVLGVSGFGQFWVREIGVNKLLV